MTRRSCSIAPAAPAVRAARASSVLLVPAARKRARRNCCLIWRASTSSGARPPTADEIRKPRSGAHAARCAVRGGDDIGRSHSGARVARRTVPPEDIAHGAGAAVSGAASPRPRTFSIPVQGAGRSRDISGREKDGPGVARRRSRDPAPRSKTAKQSPRHGMADGSVWFSRRHRTAEKNAEARWLLPMICRRGGIDKHDIGAISHSGNDHRVRNFQRGRRGVRRQDPAPRQGRQHPHRAAGGCRPGFRRLRRSDCTRPRREGKEADQSAPRNDRSRDGPQQNGKFHNASGARFDKEAGSRTKQRQQNRQTAACRRIACETCIRKEGQEASSRLIPVRLLSRNPHANRCFLRFSRTGILTRSLSSLPWSALPGIRCKPASPGLPPSAPAYQVLLSKKAKSKSRLLGDQHHIDGATLALCDSALVHRLRFPASSVQTA